MKKKHNLLIMLVCLLALGLAVTSCDNGTTEKGEYHLLWGTFTSTYSQIKTVITQQSWDVTPLGDSAGYATGDTATAIRNYNVANTQFSDGGDKDGSFEELLNFSKNGIGLPDNLKTVFADQKPNVPLAGIFDAGDFAVLFYVNKN
jgi:hypothetical protein